MVIGRRWAAFLIAVGVWSWLIWPRFGKAIMDDDRAWSGATGEGPTAFFWVHVLLIAASLAVGTAIGVLGVLAWRRAKELSAHTAPSAQ